MMGGYLNPRAFTLAVIIGTSLVLPAWLAGTRGVAAVFGVAAGLLALFCKVLRALLPPRQKKIVGFFHPYANGGGGGERVLWCAIRAVEEAFPGWQVAVYSGDGIGPEELCNSAAAKFGVSLKKPIKVVELHQRSLVEASAYPHFTLVGQALGSIALAWEALCQLRPEVFVDTAGYAFTYPLALAAGARVACYVHYPTISTDMLHRVASRQAMYNNDPTVASSALRSAIKLGYYHAFALLYGVVGACPSAVMVNSSWTEGHIVRLWWRLSPPVRLFPPCDTAKLQELPLEGRDREGSPLVLVSVAQFRPEKAHRLQLDAFRGAMHAAAFGACKRPHAVLGAKLLLIGSCRHEEDAQRLAGLREYAAELGLSDNVEFHINVSYTELVRLLGSAVGGLHTMVDEHFGISVVEYMAAGVIPIAHNSGGPRADIVQPYNRDDSTVQAPPPAPTMVGSSRPPPFSPPRGRLTWQLPRAARA